jgi:hypothetical protein
MTEQWKKIEGFENYSVSTLGRINNNDTGKLLTGKIEKRYGYRRVGLTKNGKQKFLFIHRLVAIAFIENPENKSDVDHVDNNPSNNSLENLRWATHRENLMNQQIPINNTSGVKGVCWFKRDQKWRAQIKIDGKQIYIGQFDTLEDATLARQTKANEIFGLFTNSCELIS